MIWDIFITFFFYKINDFFTNKQKKLFFLKAKLIQVKKKLDVKLILIQNNQIVSKLIIYLESILTNQQVESLSLEKKKKKKK